MPLWLNFPALCPYKQKRPMTKESKDRLTRLAAPKEAFDSPVYQSEAAHTFAPQINAMWDGDWKGRFLCHEEASNTDLRHWFKETYPTAANSAKAKGKLYEEAFRMLRPCPHAGFLEHHACRCCLRKVCIKCWRDSCPQKVRSFEDKPFETQVQEIVDALKVPRWQAKAYLRVRQPAATRLSSGRASPPPHLRYASMESSEDMSRQDMSRQRTTSAGGFGGFYSSTASVEAAPVRAQSRRRAAVSEEHEQAMEAILSSPKFQLDSERAVVFERLTRPREQKEFPDIPYLPEMSSPVPEPDELLALAGERSTSPDEADMERVVNDLEERNKIREWQANALRWCARPVFERLYDVATASRMAAAAAASRARYEAG